MVGITLWCLASNLVPAGPYWHVQDTSWDENPPAMHPCVKAAKVRFWVGGASNMNCHCISSVEDPFPPRKLIDNTSDFLLHQPLYSQQYTSGIQMGPVRTAKRHWLWEVHVSHPYIRNQIELVADNKTFMLPHVSIQTGVAC
jgi:hypothetical protein